MFCRDIFIYLMGGGLKRRLSINRQAVNKLPGSLGSAAIMEPMDRALWARTGVSVGQVSLMHTAPPSPFVLAPPLSG